jgi:hypothetical protein
VVIDSVATTEVVRQDWRAAELTWADVEAVQRRREPWSDPHLELDAVHSVRENLAAALGYVQHPGPP